MKLLSDREKYMGMLKLGEEVGGLDEIMVPGIMAINGIQGLLTVQCCDGRGRDDKLGYVAMRADKIMSDMLCSYSGVVLQVEGVARFEQVFFMEGKEVAPQFYVWFDAVTLPKSLIDLVWQLVWIRGRK